MATMIRTAQDLVSNLSVHDANLPIEFIINGKIIKLSDVGIMSVRQDNNEFSKIIIQFSE